MKRVWIFLVIFVFAFGRVLSVHANEDMVSEIKVILNKSLLAKNDMLEYGDTQGLEDMVEGWNRRFEFIAGFTEDMEKGAELEVEELDYSSIDVWRPGTYSVTVRLKICEDYSKDFTISDEVRTLSFQITVGAPEEITFAFNQITDNFVQYDFTAPKETAPVLWYAKTEPGKLPEDVNWEEGKEDFYRRSPPMVRILRSALDEHSDYFFQMRSEKLVSNILKLEASSLSDSDKKDMGGDRDGDDNDNETVEPPLIQPSPQPPDMEREPIEPIQQPSDDVPRKDSPKKASVVIGSGNEPLGQGFESVSGETLTISGARIMWLLSDSAQMVSFGWNRISLEMSASFLKGHELSSEDLFVLTLTREADLSFRITLNAKGEEIQSLGKTVVRMPVSEPQNGYTLMLNGKPLDTSVVYEQGCAVFTINQAGDYEICEESGSLETSSANGAEIKKKQLKVIPEPGFKDFFPVIVCSILLIVCGGFLLVKRR